VKGPLRILYRGPLSSCNYDCPYCPFAKRVSPPEELAADRAALERFCAFVRGASDRELEVLFTPWGEALVRPWYREAMVALSHLPHVAKVAAQTNLSCGTGWLERADRRTLALWVSFHPGEVAYPRFVAKCQSLARRGVRFSVGIVGLREHAPIARRLRDDLPSSVYVWVNAYKRGGPGYYGDADRAAFTSVDPLFAHNASPHASRGRACAAGETVISVDGDGLVRRCHFVPEVIGRLYTDDLDTILRPRPCPNAACGCHIGYVHLAHLGLDRVFEGGVLERIPRTLPVLPSSAPTLP
jgi:MoaA/NifB/PqqE/SkfB family radical SAM enzyme